MAPVDPKDLLVLGDKVYKYESYRSTPTQIVREFFPDATDEEVAVLLWNNTGFPCFWDGDPETCLRQQVKDYKESLMKPTVVCLCGSTRFSDAFQVANLQETLAGKIVLTIGCDMRSDGELFADKSEAELEEIKERLDQLHLRKIDLCDEVLILNVGGYIGKSTRRELDYARQLGKTVRFLESDHAV